MHYHVSPIEAAAVLGLDGDTARILAECGHIVSTQHVALSPDFEPFCGIGNCRYRIECSAHDPATRQALLDSHAPGRDRQLDPGRVRICQLTEGGLGPCRNPTGETLGRP